MYAKCNFKRIRRSGNPGPNHVYRIASSPNFSGIIKNKTRIHFQKLIDFIFKELLIDHTRSRQRRSAREVASEILSEPSTILEMFALGVERKQIEEKLCKIIAPSIDRFLFKYVHSVGSNGNNKDQEWRGSISDVIDIEESIWVPSLGLKGIHSGLYLF